MNPVHATAHILTINNRRLFMTVLPKDPVILLSYINTQLRDFYPSLDELCSSLNADKQTLCNTLAQIDYYYDETSNQLFKLFHSNKADFLHRKAGFYGRFILRHYFFVLLHGASHTVHQSALSLMAVRQGFFSQKKISKMQLNRRRPGQSRYSTPRNEADRVHILSGIFEGRTTGTPIAMEVINETQRSKDYSEIANSYRPGHADYTFDQKYGFRDYRGGGRSSGRETIGRVAGGAVAMKLLEQLGISITAYASSIGPVTANTFCPEEIDNNPFHLPDAEAAAMAQEYVDRMMEEKESSGGVIECRIMGVPAGLGDPVFEKLDANLSKALVSIGAVKGIEIGDGFAAAHAVGSETTIPSILMRMEIPPRKPTMQAAFWAA